MKEFVLLNGNVVSSKGIHKADVLVMNGKIAAVGTGAAGRKNIPFIDLKGRHVLPGLIDVHVHFRTPGMTKKEDWVTGSKAALAGGVTTVLDMPNTRPPTVNAHSLQEKRKLVKAKALVNYGFYAGATPQNFQAIKKMKGVAGVKIYMGSSTGNLLVDDRKVLEKFFSDKKHIFAIHAESESCIHEHMKKAGLSNDPVIHSAIRPPECAYEAVKEVLHLAKKYGTRVHLCHVSTQKELDTVRKFKNENVSVEVTPHHLFLSSKDYAEYGNLMKVNPPIREIADQTALWEGIKDGTVDMIATDHAPHLLFEKEGSYPTVPSGVPGVQTMLPLLLNAVNERHLSLEKVVELTSANPAQRFGIKGKGAIEAGMDADIAVVDMGLREKVYRQYLWSKCGWSPFEGWVLKGWPEMTFVNGNLMYEWRARFGTIKGREVQFDR